MVVLAHATANVCLDGRKKIEICLPSESVLILIYCLFNSAFKNAAFLKHFIQNVLLFSRLPGNEHLVGTHVVKKEISKPLLSFPLFFFLPSREHDKSLS